MELRGNLPILYIHGVSVRDVDDWRTVETFLREYIAPCISDDPGNVLIQQCFWGDRAAQMSFSGSSVPIGPATWLLKQSIRKTKRKVGAIKESSKKLFDNPKSADEDEFRGRWKENIVRLKSLSDAGTKARDSLSNFFSASIQSDQELTAYEKAYFSLALDETVNSDTFIREFQKCDGLEDETRFLKEHLTVLFSKYKEGFKKRQDKREDWAKKQAMSFAEFFKRTYKVPSSATARIAMELRQPLNEFVTLFLGDVFTYLHRRGDASKPGQIPLTVFEKLKELNEEKQRRDGEPLIVLSHSMGGQIMYDMVTHFLPAFSAEVDLRVDFWCATASQVGFFEELKLFLESSGEFGSHTDRLVPYPDSRYLGYWWNVWDQNDFVSYSAARVIEDVDDEMYSSGMDLVTAHIGYLVLPSFYRQFARKLAIAGDCGWQKVGRGDG